MRVSLSLQMSLKSTMPFYFIVFSHSSTLYLFGCLSFSWLGLEREGHFFIFSAPRDGGESLLIGV
uniref:Uncharacterized protein n=1 Tax=Rhizophora mucronata TaxID=61149 RepID=A0A2P2N9X4_RHIMU